MSCAFCKINSVPNIGGFPVYQFTHVSSFARSKKRVSLRRFITLFLYAFYHLTKQNTLLLPILSRKLKSYSLFTTDLLVQGLPRCFGGQYTCTCSLYCLNSISYTMNHIPLAEMLFPQQKKFILRTRLLSALWFHAKNILGLVLNIFVYSLVLMYQDTLLDI